MFILHIALQGCLKSGEIAYGVTADTGGHIKYLLELVEGATKAGVERQELVTRRFDNKRIGEIYNQPRERLSGTVDIVRIDGSTPRYLAKEELWKENDVFADNLVDYINDLDQPPDVIHAHYADAGYVAWKVKQALGIPYIFTAHSLGRVKAQTLRDEKAIAALAKRIEIEETAIRHADRVVTSSRDEAEHQYALYRHSRPERIIVNPPGCNLRGFTAEADELICDQLLLNIRRFLDDPERPPILALARPVRKKNLAGLVQAYGEDKGLQARANLVIFPGVRDDVCELDDEQRSVIEELLYLIDRYDLYGKVAIPKSHRPEDVPQIYRFAAEMGGVFVNAAFNEPFGLTFLEAAASGLPVVATASGGPNDILKTLKNGHLVNAGSPSSIASAIIELLDDPDHWNDCRQSGLDNISYYSWDRHCAEYVKDIEGLVRGPAPAIAKTGQPRDWLIVSDIDDTLVGESESLKAFDEWCRANKGCHFAVATGRSLQDAMLTLRAWKAPVPDVLITSVGAEMYFSHDLDLRHLEPDREWEERISRGWQRKAIVETLEGVAGLRLQGQMEQRPRKISYFIETAAAADAARRRLAQAGIEATVIKSHDIFLDILPKRASKGQALVYLADKLGIDRENTIAAGDSGNDLDLLRSAGLGIVVANRRSELDVLKDASNVVFSKRPYAGGILEAVQKLPQS